jgi:hypothetical protein
LNDKSFVFNADMSKSSLQVCKFDVGRDFQAEPSKQDCLMVCGAAALHPHSAEVYLDPFLTGLLTEQAGLRRRFRLRYSLDAKPALLI